MNNILVRIFEALNKQRKDRSSPDIIDLVFDDGSKIPVHRFLLMTTSDTFHKMLTNGMKESNQKEIPIFPPHVNGFRAMIEQVCYGRDNSKLDYETKIWGIICKHKYRIEYDLDELNIDVPEDGLGLLLYLAEMLEYNDTIRSVVIHNCTKHNANIPFDTSNIDIATMVLWCTADKYFGVYNIIDNKIYHSHNIHIFYDDFKNAKETTNMKISYQCYDKRANKYWIMMLDGFSGIGDYSCFDPRAMGEEILFNSNDEYIYAIHPAKNHITMVGLEYMYVFNYRERKLVDKYKIDFGLCDSRDDNSVDDNSVGDKIKDIILSCNGKYTLCCTRAGDNYIFDGSKMIRKLSKDMFGATFHPIKDNIVIFIKYIDKSGYFTYDYDDDDDYSNNNDIYVLVVYDIITGEMYELADLIIDNNYYFSTNGEYLYTENSIDDALTFIPLKPGSLNQKYCTIEDLGMETIIIPDPKNEQGVYCCARNGIRWLNINKNMCVPLKDIHDGLLKNISNISIFK